MQRSLRGGNADWIGAGMTEIISDDALVTVTEAAELAGVRPGTIYQWIHRGFLPIDHRGMGRRIWLTRLDVAKAEHATARAAGRSVAALPPALQPSRQPVVYYLRFGERIKIGTTVSLISRLSDLPYDEVLAIEPGGSEVEAARHKQFAAFRITGEWFALVDEIREHLRGLRCVDGCAVLADM